MLTACQEKNKPSVSERSVNLFLMELSLKDQHRYHERLRQEMRRRGIDTQIEFARLLGVSDTYVYQLFSDKRSGARQLINFARRLKVPVGYLLGAEELPDNYAIPIVSGRIAANPLGRIPGDAIESQLYFPHSELHGRHDLVAVRLAPDADSMEPTLHPGDLVIIDRGDRELTPRGLFAVRLPDQESCTIKRLQLVPDKQIILLLSDNPKYDPLPVADHGHLIIGRVIWSMTYRINSSC